MVKRARRYLSPVSPNDRLRNRALPALPHPASRCAPKAGGVGPPIDPDRPFVLVMQHPVTTEYGHGMDQINETLEAVASLKMQALVFWPNVDAAGLNVSNTTVSGDIVVVVEALSAHR